MLDLSGIQVLYEDNHLIAVNKPPGMLVQGDITGDTPLSEYVREYIRLRYKKPGNVFVGVTHRLDRPVSGVVLFARTSKALPRINELFKNKQIEKTYLAITGRRPDPLKGHLSHFILKDKIKNIAKAYDKIGNRTKEAKQSDLDYELIGELNKRYLLKINPSTGRPHQIRVQLASIDCPIWGDVKYGFPTPNKDGSIHLNCRSLAFEHTVKKEPVYIEADPPDDFLWNQFDI
jgi:23S rRNA pseudouridine1911/1915/1917 synthase